jgi:K+-sensing histidine kinase KdpD
MAKELSGKIWWAIFLPYHILIFASIIKFKNSIQNIFIFYFAIVLIYGIFKGLTKIITSNFSVNLFEWFRPKRENTYDIDDSARTISNHKLIFIIGIIGVVMFFLLKQIKFE